MRSSTLLSHENIDSPDGRSRTLLASTGEETKPEGCPKVGFVAEHPRLHTPPHSSTVVAGETVGETVWMVTLRARGLTLTLALVLALTLTLVSLSPNATQTLTLAQTLTLTPSMGHKLVAPDGG